jgi:hypothetical protein
MIDEPKPAAEPAEPVRFFQRADWAAFWLASGLSFVVYLFTLVPSADLRFSGIFCTAAMYLGVSNPPAYPVWTVYSAIFAHLLPISNIGWRVAVATATSSALAAGLVAMMVSRIGSLAADDLPGFKSLTQHEQKAFQMVCGCVAGLSFSLDGCFWRKALVADQWNFNVALFTFEIFLLTRWFFRPDQKRYLYAASLLQGLILSDSEALFPTAYAMPFLVALGDRKLGRDMLFLLCLLLCVVPISLAFDQLFIRAGSLDPSMNGLAIGAAIVAGTFCFLLTIQTRSLLSEWKAMLCCSSLLFIGGCTCLLTPIFSMMDPPINWGYPRTVEGFFHVLSRGQYEAFHFNSGFPDLLIQWKIYGRIAANDFGIIYLAAALIPFALLPRMPSTVRNWLVGLLVVWFLVSELMLTGLQPTQERVFDLIAPFFAATHLLLAIMSGCGLMLLAVHWVPSIRSPRA